MKRIGLLLLAAVTLQAQPISAQTAKKNLFNHLDVGLTVGTTGLGFDVATPAGDYVRLRTGMSFVPRIEFPMSFDIQVGNDPATSHNKFNRLASMLESFTGQPVSEQVEMIGKPLIWNWNVLVDVFPLKNNKHWRVTAGFFLGPGNVAEAFNKTESMTSLLAVDIYNNLYNKLHGKTIRELADTKLVDLGKGYEDVYFDLDLMKRLQKSLDDAGRMGMPMGKYSHDIVDEDGNVIHQKGDTYVMEPDQNHMATANMKVNSFKPYIGLGYDGKLVKGNERLHISVDAGIMLWGGKPKVTTHDGTDLINDIEDLKGKVGDYVSSMSKMVLYPVVNVRFAYNIF